MIHNHIAQQKLLKLCELTALKEKMPFAKAVDLVMSKPENFGLMTQAAGYRWKGKPLKAATLRNWIDPIRKQYIKDYPKITIEQKHQIAAFLPVRKRDRNEIHRESARKLAALGYSQRRIAETIGISRSALSKWSFPKSAPWHVEAMKLHYNHVSGRKIARKLGLDHNKVARFLRGKPRGPDPYAPDKGIPT
jgi:transcriptional regulator with XRE-family HTH domain